MIRYFKVIVIFCLISCFSQLSFSQPNDDNYDVPFVPTIYPVVEQMLTLADVGPDDLLYDLGCGDGRIVIAAAQKFGARGIGIDINPVRIAESKENADKAGVADKVTFMVGDLFTANFHNATVVSLYLLDSVNRKLRPRILKELKPGTRIVSHDFDMDEWEPDQTVVVESNDSGEQSFRNHTVYFWIVPDNISGSWKILSPNIDVRKKAILYIEQSFQRLNGRLVVDTDEWPIESGYVQGNKIFFTLSVTDGGREQQNPYSGIIDGDSIIGTTTPSATGENRWQAKRDPATKLPVEKLWK